MQSDHCEPDPISGRVPTVYLTSVFLWFFSVLVFRRISNLRDISPHWEFDSHPVRSGLPANTVPRHVSRGIPAATQYKLAATAGPRIA